MRSQDREWIHEILGQGDPRTGSGFMRSQDREWLHEILGQGVAS